MRKLSRTAISYLSFEGGGGAGNAYPGAIGALHDLGILDYSGARAGLAPEASLTATANNEFRRYDWQLKHLKGVSGASAGAINALFISLGYTPSEIEYILATNDFNSFFDEPTPGLRPYIGGLRKDQLGAIENLSEALRATPAGRLVDNFGFLTGGSTSFALLISTFCLIVATLPVHAPDALLDTLSSDMRAHTAQAAFLYDFGIFPGFVIRRFFARYISLAVERILRDDASANLQSVPVGLTPGTLDFGFGGSFVPHWEQNPVWTRTSEITFAQHREIFGNDLIVTGTNLETTKSHFFSAATTPRFPVVDAVRISMSIPFLFKPMRIKANDDLAKVINRGESTTNHYLKGVWADGGLLNNMPVTAFDALAGGPQHTLGLMVGIDGRSEISSVASFLGAYIEGFLGGTGDSQVSETTSDVDRVLVIDTTDQKTGQTITMLDFKLDPIVYKNINDQSRQAVNDFFATRAAP